MPFMPLTFLTKRCTAVRSGRRPEELPVPSKTCYVYSTVTLTIQRSYACMPDCTLSWCMHFEVMVTT